MTQIDELGPVLLSEIDDLFRLHQRSPFCWLSVVEGRRGTPHAHLDLAPD